jgi:Zn-dependent protease
MGYIKNTFLMFFFLLITTQSLLFSSDQVPRNTGKNSSIPTLIFWRIASPFLFLERSIQAVHELGHAAAAYAFCLPIEELYLEPVPFKSGSAARFDKQAFDSLEPYKKIAILAAGPCAQITYCALLLSCNTYDDFLSKQLLYAGIAEGCFNIMPLPGTDGYEIARLFAASWR